MEERITRLRQKANILPLRPGVYLMKNSAGKIIYVGKAKLLKNRVSQYFHSGAHEEKVIRMVENIEDFDFILTDTEFEALVLECSLIKQNQPRYNILLKDDKGYSYIRISPGPWSHIDAAKQKEDDGAEYLGPFMSSLSVRERVDEARKVFRLPDCKRDFSRKTEKIRPCLNFSIGQCSAPCAGRIRQSDYQESIKSAVDYLKNGSDSMVERLTAEMEAAAENLQFELAARYRDRIKAIKRLSGKQKMVSHKPENQDVLALAQSPKKACFVVFRFRGGWLTDKESFLMGEVGGADEAMGEFIQQYYSTGRDVPPDITIDCMPADHLLLTEWLTSQRGKKVRLRFPQAGDQLKLLQLCKANAAELLGQDTGVTGREANALDELTRLLGLTVPPARIEAYDISNLAGQDNVAGMVVFRNGRPLKSAYRKFGIKYVTGQDDYLSMREVITRRFHEYNLKKDDPKETDGFGALPDLILLDGGKGHVSAILPVLEAAGLDVPAFGMVKDSKHKTRAIATDGGEIEVIKSRAAFTLIASIQEEVHRFAVGYHHQKRKKTNIGLSLTEIKGVGQARAAALLKHFKTVTAIKQASLAEIEVVKGVDKPTAKAVFEHYRVDN